MASSLKKFAPRREHKERGQVTGRRHLGHLEKHKDYVLRAKSYKRKQQELKRLRSRAEARNPDEFYFGMINAKVKDGVHIEERNEKLSDEMRKLIETQDLKYVRAQRDINRKKIERLQNSMHILDTRAVDKDGPKHTVFVDGEEEVAGFNAAKHFNTMPELLSRSFNRPTIEAIESGSVGDRLVGKQKRRAVKERIAIVNELKDRLDREQQLKRAETEMALQKALKEKGEKKRVVGKNQMGLAVYKWKAERKK